LRIALAADFTTPISGAFTIAVITIILMFFVPAETRIDTTPRLMLLALGPDFARLSAGLACIRWQ
jgi:hypothetical protein